MRRKDREITDTNEIDAILMKTDVCRVAFSDGNTPYIVAMNFGYVPGYPPTLYFHCAQEGRKLDLMKKNSLVCFQADTDHELVRAEKPCDWGMKYRSVTGYGRLTRIADGNEIRKALAIIMDHYGEKRPVSFDPEIVEKTAVLKLEVTEISGKKKGY